MCSILCGTLGLKGLNKFGLLYIKNFLSFYFPQGYRVEGPSSRRCLGNGEWDGEEPYCRGKHLFYHIQQDSCFLYRIDQRPLTSNKSISRWKEMHYTVLPGIVLLYL